MKKIIASIALLACVAGAPPALKIEFEAPETYPEGVVYYEKENVYFVSSERLGQIGKVTPDGNYTAFHTDNSLKSSYGLKISPDQKKLYACVADANYSKFQTPDTKKKMGRLVSFDIKSGKKLMDIDLASLVPGKHFPNDLAFDKSGNAYVTDSYANAIYKITADGKASVFCKNDMFKTEGVGLNGIVWHSGNFLIVDNGATGCLYKVSVSDPSNVTKIKTGRFFLNADGLLLTDPNTLALVQNGNTNVIYQLKTTDNWQTAKVSGATALEDRFAFPTTATSNKSDVWIVNAKSNELADSTSVPSKKFCIQRAIFRPMP